MSYYSHGNFNWDKSTEWQPQNRTTKLFNVSSHSTEYTRVVGKFTATMSNVNIVSVNYCFNIIILHNCE